ncbi:MAG: NAD(P)/FAD-dependent oxidoreductase [Candidatus Altiarchaeota archaeon]
MISIIGAGPVGCFSAISAIENGNDVEIFEAQKIENRKVKCSGLVSVSGIFQLSLSLPNDCILNKVRGAKIFSPSGKEILINAKEEKAFVLDRRKFDNFLLNRAIDRGAVFKNEKISDLKKIKGKRIVLATGTNYNLQKKLNLPTPKKFLIGAQYEMKISCEKEFVELYFGKKIAPNFFSWVIPIDDNYGRVGLCTEKETIFYLKNFLRKLKKKGRIKNEKIFERNFGIIPIYDPKMKTQFDNIALVGDAAAQVKATTGGGIILGCIAAKFSHDEDYEKKWRKEIGKELYLHLQIRKFLNKLSDKNLERLFSLIDENKEIIQEKGDMDLASRIIFPLVKEPRFILNFLSKLPYFVCDLL